MTLLSGRIWESLLLFGILLVPGSTYDPTFDLPLHNVTAKQGTEVSFTCVVNHLGDFKVAWIKSDDKVILAYHTNKVSHNPRYHVTHNGHNTWTLIIKNVQKSDGGEFMCQINTNPMTMQIGWLEVVVPADIIDEETSGDVVVAEGHSAILQCKATGSPPPKVRWKRQDGSPLPLSRELLNPGEKVLEWEGETLPLRALGKADNGAFLCIASNNIPPLVSKRVMVYVQFKPLIKVSNQLVAAPAEINVTLECDVESVPKPFVSWTTKEGQLIVPTESKYLANMETLNDYTVRAKLTIVRLHPDDFSDYNCSARNTLGEDAGIIKLQRIYPAPTIRTTPTSTHHQVKHQLSKDHERQAEGTGKHIKGHRGKLNRAKNHGRGHNFPHEESYYDLDGDGPHVTTVASMNNPKSQGHGALGQELKTTTPSPWGTKTTWGKGGKNGAPSSIHFAKNCLPIFIPLFIVLSFLTG